MTVLEQLIEQVEKEANEKIKKAMQLFIRCDDEMKSVVLYASGFRGQVTAKRLREHFDTMELMDSLDSAIEDMEFDLEN